MDEISFRAVRKDIEHIKNSLVSVDKTLALQAQSLEEHMRRSEANEKAIDILKDELKPIVLHVTSVKTVLKIIGWLGASGILVFLFSKTI